MCCRRGFPPFTMPTAAWSDVPPLFVGALAIARGRPRRHHVDGLGVRVPAWRAGAGQPGDDRHRRGEHREPGLFQGFPVSTSGSRTAVADQAGSRSQVTGVVGAVAITLVLVLFPSG